MIPHLFLFLWKAFDRPLSTLFIVAWHWNDLDEISIYSLYHVDTRGGKKWWYRSSTPNMSQLWFHMTETVALCHLLRLFCRQQSLKRVRLLIFFLSDWWGRLFHDMTNDDICSANITGTRCDGRTILGHLARWQRAPKAWPVHSPSVSVSLWACTVGQWAPCMWPPRWRHPSATTNLCVVSLPPQQTPLSLHPSEKLASAGICSWTECKYEKKYFHFDTVRHR